MRTPERITEKKHRLDRHAYRGQVAVSATCCLLDRKKLFTSAAVVHAVHERLVGAAARNDTDIALYCYMPDHLHLILRGRSESADLWATLARFKQATGFWLARHTPGFQWQKDFYDHILRDEREFWNTVYYILNNPIRGGLVDEWAKYPFIGSQVWTHEELLG